MLMIRRVEEHCIHFHEEHHGLLRGHFHVYIGQEATGVSVCESLNNDDYVFTTHRNHGHVIAKGGDPKKVLAEIIGRATGYCQGRAGTFHVAAPEVGIVHTSAIVGGCLALAAGTAEFIPLSFWYDAPLISRYSDRRHDPWQVYGSPSCSPAQWSFWISRA
jgi:TPP-dependent pyruvate/acetoin dehydrogenase alpha subunit